ncbi:hypothetical protein RchiOBHm_Chr2g0162881 [Rosa chinensis]|uniref:Transmembrane protein n=1 Tax=Rosa chinensis TaxID=74649 RepID=A0A2P6S340_ROSCH|nr:hypothetical protein RchiOBHm_Chr2g0162881 [Rosa chinensis]
MSIDMVGALMSIALVGALLSLDLVWTLLRIYSIGTLWSIHSVWASWSIDMIRALVIRDVVVGALPSICVVVGTWLSTCILTNRSHEGLKDILCCIQLIRTTDLRHTFRATTLGVLEFHS